MTDEERRRDIFLKEMKERERRMLLDAIGR
jgi:hypothetical protein